MQPLAFPHIKEMSTTLSRVEEITPARAHVEDRLLGPELLQLRKPPPPADADLRLLAELFALNNGKEGDPERVKEGGTEGGKESSKEGAAEGGEKSGEDGAPSPGWSVVGKKRAGKESNEESSKEAYDKHTTTAAPW